jgi:hypothetical protein
MGLKEAIQNIWASDYTQKNPNKAYKVSYADEYAKVATFINGGPEPANWQSFSKLGAGLVEAEVERRKATQPEPEPEPEPEPGTGILRDKPPGYPNYTGYTKITHDGRAYYRLSDNVDYLFVNGLGDFSYSEGVYLEGGRNVVVIGGRITATGLERGHGVGLSLKGHVAAAHHYIEGVRIRPQYDGTKPLRRLHDGFATRGAVGKITIQNCLVGPVAIKEGFTPEQGHADVLQVQAGPWEGELRVNRLTGMTDYTGIMESEILVRKQNWHEVNLRGVDIDPANKAWTTFYANNATTMAGLSLTEFYCDAFGAGAVPSSLNNIIKRGLPAGGDYVTEADVKLPYVSPGYA